MLFNHKIVKVVSPIGIESRLGEILPHEILNLRKAQNKMSWTPATGFLKRSATESLNSAETIDSDTALAILRISESSVQVQWLAFS